MSDYDPARATALLDLYGYVDRDGDGWREQPDGSPLLLEYATQPDQPSRQLAELWQKNMKAIGLRIVFKVAKWPENLKASRAGKLMMWGVGWSADHARRRHLPRAGLRPEQGRRQPCALRPAGLQRAVRAGRTRCPTAPSAQTVMEEASKLMVAYVPYKLSAHRIVTDLMQPWVIGYQRNPFVREFCKYVDVDPAIRAQETP